MQSEKARYILPASERVRVSSAEAGANVYLLSGRVHFEVPESDQALELERRGALHIANLRFDAERMDRAFSGGEISRLNAGSAWLRFAGSTSN